jgi:hypothetical protein
VIDTINEIAARTPYNAAACGAERAQLEIDGCA